MMTCLLFREHLDTLLIESNFSLDLYVFEILKNLVTFSSFSVKAFFHNFSLKYFFQNSHKWFLYVLVVLMKLFWQR